MTEKIEAYFGSIEAFKEISNKDFFKDMDNNIIYSTPELEVSGTNDSNSFMFRVKENDYRTIISKWYFRDTNLYDYSVSLLNRFKGEIKMPVFQEKKTVVTAEDIVKMVTSKAEELKIKITKKMGENLNAIAKQVLQFRASQVYFGKDCTYAHLEVCDQYDLPNWVIEDVIIEEILSRIQKVKPSRTSYRNALRRLEVEYATVDIEDIPDDVEDETLINLMKHNGAVITHDNNALRFVPPYLSNQFPYKEDLYVEVLSGTPFIHYTKDEVLKRSVEVIIGYAEEEHTCQCSSNLDDIYNTISELENRISILEQNQVDNRGNDIDVRCVEPLTQEQEEEILKKTIDTQQRIKRNNFEKTFDSLYESLYVPISPSTYDAYVEKYGDSIEYIRFKKVPTKSILVSANNYCPSYEKDGELKTILAHVMNPHILLSRISDIYIYNKIGNMWVLSSNYSTDIWTAPSLEELLLKYMIDSNTDRDTVYEDIHKKVIINA